ncbi:MAG: FAD-binding oxidoreductase [Actinomycetota bacterium]
MTSAAEVVGLLPAEIVSLQPDDRAAHARDMSAAALLERRRGHQPAGPEVVVRPRSVDDVAAVVRAAQSAGVPVVPRGGGSGVSGGVVADEGIVLDLREMNRVLDIDESSLTVTVEAGISGPELAGELARNGYTLGHEPQSLSVSTVGGWIATRACGQLSAGYGGIEDLLVGLEAVLPDGRIVSARPTTRRSTGPELADLMIGAEGTLGVVTRATLRIRRMPEERVDMCFRFESMEQGLDDARVLAQTDLRPVLLRLYDRDDAALFWLSYPDPPGGPILLASFEGSFAEQRAERAAELVGGQELSRDVVAYWRAHRNDALESYLQLMAGQGPLGAHALVDTMEVSAVWKDIPTAYAELKGALGSVADIAACHLSHVYPEGACLYFVLASACADESAAQTTYARWWEVGMGKALEVGAAISHHHGVGRLKARWLPAEIGGWWDVLRAVKKELDPKGIMNPGALGL